MKSDMMLVFYVVVVLTGSSHTRGQSSAAPPVLALPILPGHAGGSASPHLTKDPGNEVPQRTQNPAGRDETTAITPTQVHSETKTHSHMTSSSPHTDVPGSPSPSAAADVLSSTPALQSTTPPQRISAAEGSTFSSQAAHTEQDTSSMAHASTAQSELLTTAAQPTTPEFRCGTRGPTRHREVPPEFNVGDENLKGPHSSSPLDPLLAGLLSVFIVTTAVVFVILFLKFRQRTNHPEFHRLQDLPMDDLMEDTPLSRSSY